MQMTASQEQVLDLEHYLAKTYCKTASLMANSLRSVAVLSGSDNQVRQSPATRASVSCHDHGETGVPARQL